MRRNFFVQIFVVGLVGCGDDGPPVDAPGIINLGATCYYNSLWQVLAHAAPFRAYVEQLSEIPPESPHARERNFLAAAKRMVTALWEPSREAVDSTDMFAAFRAFDARTYRPRSQADAAEAFAYLVARLEESALAAGAARTDIFDTEEHDEVACREPPVQYDDDFKHLATVTLTLGGQRGARKELADLARTHFDAINFDGCEGGTRRAVLTHAPEMLVLVIDRQVLAQDAEGRLAVAGKRTDPVTIPMELDLSEQLADARYGLAGVIYHTGSDNRGHFVADYYHTVLATWVRANDKKTFGLENLPEDSRSAYMYFFLKQH